jgi:ABC-type branched-subunit amino acid transport system ATPase component
LRLPKFRKKRKPWWKKAERLLSIMGLTERRDLGLNNLPYGMQRRLEIVRALAFGSEAVVARRTAAGMNPDETEQLMRLISRIRDCSAQRTRDRTTHGSHHGYLRADCRAHFGIKLAEGCPADISKIRGYRSLSGCHRGGPRHVEIKDLHVSYRGIRALKGVSLEVRAGRS